MIRQLQQYMNRPALYSPSTKKFWDDPHISKGMLEAHLNPNVNAASRKLDFIQKSVGWIASTFPSAEYPVLLDLGCGPGIYAEQFCTEGYEVTGVDLSERSIHYAQNSASSKGLEIHYLQGDYLQLSLPGQYDLITMIYCDLGVLSDCDRAGLLEKVSLLLRPGGCFLFDVFTPQAYAGKPERHDWEYCSAGGFWSEEPYLYLNSLYRYDEANTFLHRHIVVRDEWVNCYNVWEHTFDRDELERESMDAGFERVSFYDDIAGAPYSGLGDTICTAAVKGAKSRKYMPPESVSDCLHSIH